MKTLFKTIPLLPLLMFACKSEEPDTKLTTITPAEMCGTVQFSDGCGEALDSMIAYGIALIHHMTYEDAETVFDQVIQEDPDCFWGHWGKAMSYFHPLWPDQVSPEQMQHGQILSQRALALARKEREKAFGKAVAAFYEGSDRRERARLVSYEEAWKGIHEEMPEDVEASAFYALSMLSTVPPEDKSYEKQRAAGALAESIIDKIPDHPGGFHYAIHAYDFPPLADKALEVARNYGKIAPEIPHALHMPSHIFTRRGYWEESIYWNDRSSKAAIKRYGPGSIHNLHALDYLAYAYLQTGQDAKAKQVAEQVAAITGPVHSNPGGAYALAAIPARLALERGQWDVAATLTVPRAEEFPWANYPQYEALTYFAKGVGAARSGKTGIAKNALERMREIHRALAGAPENSYWATQVEIKLKAVEAWLAYAQGRKDDALKAMQASADLEAASEKNPVTPGELLPAREMLGDMLMNLGKPEKALEAYRASLTDSPNRLNTLYGAARAAEAAGHQDVAREYYAHVLELAGDHTGDRTTIRHAREVLAVKEQ